MMKLAVLCIFALMAVAYGKKCYNCNTALNKDCKNPSDSKSAIISECSGKCQIVQGKSGKEEVTFRGCTTGSASTTNPFSGVTLDGCAEKGKEVEFGGAKIKYSCCDKELCNGAMAGANVAYVVMLLTTTVSVVAYKLF